MFFLALAEQSMLHQMTAAQSVMNSQRRQCCIMGLGACPVDFTVLEVLPNSPTRAGDMQVN